MAKIGETITLQGGIKTGYAPGTSQWDVGQGSQVKILNQRTVNGQMYYDIQHIGGGTGWTLGSELDKAINPQVATPPPANISNTANAEQLAPPVTPAVVGNQQVNALYSMGNQVNAATQALTSAITEQQTKNEANLTAEQQKLAGAQGEIQKLVTPFRQTEETAGRAKYGTEQVLVEQKALLGELNQLLTEGNDLIRQQKEMTGLAAIRNPRIQKTMDDVLARAGVIEAVVNLQNTYLANAYQSIDRTVGAIANDRQDQINYYSSVLNMANNNIINLSSEKKDLAQQQIDILKANLNQSLTSANYIKELMTNPSTALSMAKAGVTLNDSVEQINAKMANYQMSKEIQDMTNQFTSAGAQPVYDPASIPADRLLSFTDSSGKVHYFEVPKAPKTTDGTINADDFLKTFSIEDFLTSVVSDGGDTSDTTSNAPTYTPSNLGATYIDPTTGDLWQFTGKGNNNGWVII
jgi:hypothetical protein